METLELLLTHDVLADRDGRPGMWPLGSAKLDVSMALAHLGPQTLFVQIAVVQPSAWWKWKVASECIKT